MPKILNREQLLNLNYVEPNDKLHFINSKATINWIYSNAIIVNITSKQKRLAFDECFDLFTKNQIPKFKYVVNENEVLIIRCKNRNFVYAPKLPVKIFEYFHPMNF